MYQALCNFYFPILINDERLNMRYKETNPQIGVTMWQTIDRSESFFIFCSLVGASGIVSYILVIYHLFVAPA